MKLQFILIVILGLFPHIDDAQEQAGIDKEQPVGLCHENKFPCYKDCCPKDGDWFCHHRQERCVSCDTREAQCGNESLPLECLLHCHKLLNPASTQDDMNGIYLSWTTVIIGTALLSIAIMFAVLFWVILRSIAKRTPLDKWPVYLRGAFGKFLQRYILCAAQIKHDPNLTDEETLMLATQNSSTHDIDVGCSSSVPQSSCSVSNNINPPADTQGLNLTVHDDDEESASLPANPYGDNEAPEQGDTTPSSSSGGTPPPQGHELGANLEAGYRSNEGTPLAFSHGENAQGFDLSGVAESSNPTAENNRRLPPHGMPQTTLASGEESARFHQDPNRDIEVGSQARLNTDPARGGTLAAHQNGLHQPFGQPHLGFAVNEDRPNRRQDFNNINPSKERETHGHHVEIVTGVGNPVDPYRQTTTTSTPGSQ